MNCQNLLDSIIISGMRSAFTTVFFAISGAGFVHATEDLDAPWRRHAFDVESGILWEAGHNTSINYQLVPTQFTWRSPFMFKTDFDNGSTLVVRNQVSLITTWVSRGPEDYYFGASAAPSIEWWSANDQWSLYFSIGGGFGLTNSTDVPGGLGQDFTLNWFTKAGVRYQIQKDLGIFGGPFFQHMSNGGATSPNPGVDALGFTVGMSFSF